MGAAQSTEDVLAAVNQAQADNAAAAKQPAERGCKLFHFVSAGSGGAWEVITSNASPRFYNANEDTGKKAYDWHLEIDGSDVDVRVDQELGYVMDMPGRRLTFSAEGVIYALRFGNEEQFRQFMELLNDYAFSNTYGVDNDETSRKKYLGEDYANVFFSKDIVDKVGEAMEEDTEEGPPSVTPTKMREQQALDEDEEGEEAIQGIVIGAMANNYLVRGRKFDVLRNIEGGVEDKGISFMLTPPPGTPKGRGIGGPSYGTPGLTPSRVLLANMERRMNILTPENPHLVHHANIETGQIINTFTFNKDGADIPIQDIVHESKAGQMEESNTFLGLDNNRLCRWDIRDPSGVVSASPLVHYDESRGKDFARGTNFTCMATSGSGWVAVGSKDGKVRLYNDKSLKQAKTAIPGLGAPITAIDVTFDGKWVLATTDRYLMVVKTTYEDDSGKPCNAFTAKMGNRGVVPRLLRLKPEDAGRVKGSPLTKGKFTWITESGTQERWVVANCGMFSVIWNFNRLKSTGAESLSFGGLPTSFDYVMTAKEEEVVDAAFLHSRYARNAGADASLVVATGHQLFNLGG